jgi:diguanylate cyclase (GGDEF)-like protein
LKPHFYETWPFFGLCGIGLMLLGAGGYSLRVRQLHERQKKLERLVGERTSELAEANRKLERLATVDGLTGVANRRLFDNVLAREWARSRRTERPLSLIMIDIDFFKDYNDSYGHLAGDDCLKKVAETLAWLAARTTDLVARYGGEEFAVILPETTADDAASMAKRMRHEVEALCIEHTGSAIGECVTISAGVATAVPDPQASPDELVSQADDALYKAKEGGRNRIMESS